MFLKSQMRVEKTGTLNIDRIFKKLPNFALVQNDFYTTAIHYVYQCFHLLLPGLPSLLFFFPVKEI